MGLSELLFFLSKAVRKNNHQNVELITLDECHDTYCMQSQSHSIFIELMH